MGPLLDMVKGSGSRAEEARAVCSGVLMVRGMQGL